MSFGPTRRQSPIGECWAAQNRIKNDKTERQTSDEAGEKKYCVFMKNRFERKKVIFQKQNEKEEKIPFICLLIADGASVPIPFH